MINKGRTGWRRGVGLVAVVAAAAATAVALAGSAAAVVSAPQGGYLLQLGHFHSATMELRVPTLSCGNSSTPRVRVGLFGHSTYDHQRTPWFTAVVSQCRQGHQRSFSEFGDYTETDRNSVRHRDLVRISTRAVGRPSYGYSPLSVVADLTSGDRLAGEPATIGAAKP